MSNHIFNKETGAATGNALLRVTKYFKIETSNYRLMKVRFNLPMCWIFSVPCLLLQFRHHESRSTTKTLLLIFSHLDSQTRVQAKLNQADVSVTACSKTVRCTLISAACNIESIDLV